MIARIALRLGVVPKEESDGVANRLKENELRALLLDCGFSPFRIRRIVMLPGALFFGKMGRVKRFFASEVALKILNLFLGRFGTYFFTVVVK